MLPPRRHTRTRLDASRGGRQRDPQGGVVGGDLGGSEEEREVEEVPEQGVCSDVGRLCRLEEGDGSGDRLKTDFDSDHGGQGSCVLC